MGRRRLRVVGKGGKERTVPIDAAFFSELGAYLRRERPTGLGTSECFVGLRGPTAGAPLPEAGLRSLFRRHRDTSRQLRVRPHPCVPKWRLPGRHGVPDRRSRPQPLARKRSARLPASP